LSSALAFSFLLLSLSPSSRTTPSASSIPSLIFAYASPAQDDGGEAERRRRRRQNQQQQQQQQQRQQQRQKQKQKHEQLKRDRDDNKNDRDKGDARDGLSSIIDLAIGGGGGRYNPDGDVNDDDNPSNSPSSRLSHLFITRRPRDALDGIKCALHNAIRGTFYGLAVAIGSPFALYSKFGFVGLLSGAVVGGVLGMILPVTGAIVGSYQLLRGLYETPRAIVEDTFHCRIYDEDGRLWVDYRLDDDIEEIRKSMEVEREREREEGRGKAGRTSSTSGGGRARHTEYYDLLNVSPHATSSEIRSAYRRRAREIHPDKNVDDDPDTAVRKFRDLSAAYQTLSNPERRRKYDATGIGINAEDPNGDDTGGGGGMSATIDPIVFFAVLFGSELVEPYVGELGMATMFDALLKLGGAGGDGGGASSFDSWDDLKAAFGWSTTALKRRKRETDIAAFLRTRVSDYVEGYLGSDAFRDSCREEAIRISRGGGSGGASGGGGPSYGASFLLAIGPALIVEADAFLGYRSSVLGSWRGPVSNLRRTMLFAKRKFSVARATMKTVREGMRALYNSAEVMPDDDERKEKPSSERQRHQQFVINDKELLRDNLSNTIPTVLSMAWAINYVDISNALHGACVKLFRDANIASWEERLRRAEAVHILGTQFYLVGMETTSSFRDKDGNNSTTSGGGNVDDIKARASAAFVESLKKGKDKFDDEM
jgi:hypothetical protein